MASAAGAAAMASAAGAAAAAAASAVAVAAASVAVAAASVAVAAASVASAAAASAFSAGLLHAETERAATAAPATRSLRSSSEVMWRSPWKRSDALDSPHMGNAASASEEYAVVRDKGKTLIHALVITFCPAVVKSLNWRDLPITGFVNSNPGLTRPSGYRRSVWGVWR